MGSHRSERSGETKRGFPLGVMGMVRHPGRKGSPVINDKEEGGAVRAEGGEAERMMK